MTTTPRPADPAVSPAWPEARAMAHRAAAPLPPERVSLELAVGRTLAADLRATTCLPAFTSSAMDGWAVRGTGPWLVVGESGAGRPFRAPLGAGEAVRIATGAVLPPEAAGIVRREDGIESGATLWTADLSAPVGRDVRSAGEEAAAGDLLATAATVVTPPLAGLAAAAGHDTLTVRPRPRVGLVLLGDELLASGPARDGRVRDALGVQLPAWIDWCGGTVSSRATVPDRLADAGRAIAAVDADVVVTTGGSSVGWHDHVRAAVHDLGGRYLIDQVAVRPGHPMLLAALPDGRRLVALPGNPGAALAAVLTLVEPLLAGLLGRPATPPRRVVLARAVAAGHDHRIVPAVDDGSRATPLDAAGPAALSGWAVASSALVIPPGGAGAGTTVRSLPLPYGSHVRSGRREQTVTPARRRGDNPVTAPA